MKPSTTLEVAQATLLLLAAGLAGCGATEVCPSGACETRVAVAKQISFAVESDGVSAGFDLDDKVSVGQDFASCRQVDYVSPEGEPGIDNQFSLLWEAIVDVVGDSVEGLLQTTINEGNLLLMLEVTGIDDVENDDCVDVRLFVGAGQPQVGTDGFIAADQTFDVDTSSPVTAMHCARIRDRYLTARNFDGVIPIAIFDKAFDLRVYGAMLRAYLAEDGSMPTVMGAGVDGQQIIEVAEDADYRLRGFVATIVRNESDLMPDEYGDCQRLSATLLYEGTGAFLFEDTTWPEY